MQQFDGAASGRDPGTGVGARALELASSGLADIMHQVEFTVAVAVGAECDVRRTVERVFAVVVTRNALPVAESAYVLPNAAAHAEASGGRIETLQYVPARF